MVVTCALCFGPFGPLWASFACIPRGSFMLETLFLEQVSQISLIYREGGGVLKKALNLTHLFS